MLTVLAWVPPKQSLIQRLTCWWWLGNWNLRHMDTSWGRERPSQLQTELTTAMGHTAHLTPWDFLKSFIKGFSEPFVQERKGRGGSATGHLPPEVKG